MARLLVQKQAPEAALFSEVLGRALSAYLGANPGVTKTEVAQRAGTTLDTLYRWAKPELAQASAGRRQHGGGRAPRGYPWDPGRRTGLEAGAEKEDW